MCINVYYCRMLRCCFGLYTGVRRLVLCFSLQCGGSGYSNCSGYQVTTPRRVAAMHSVSLFSPARRTHAAFSAALESKGLKEPLTPYLTHPTHPPTRRRPHPHKPAHTHRIFASGADSCALLGHSSR